MTADFSILFAQYCERFHAPVHGVVPSFCLDSIFVWKYQLLHLRCPVPVGRPVQVSPKLSFLPAPRQCFILSLLSNLRLPVMFGRLNLTDPV